MPDTHHTPLEDLLLEYAEANLLQGKATLRGSPYFRLLLRGVLYRTHLSLEERQILGTRSLEGTVGEETLEDLAAARIQAALDSIRRMELRRRCGQSSSRNPRSC